MPQALGDFPVNGKVSFLWNTNGQDGASITRSTDGTLKIFKSHATAATWATERSSLAGVTQLEDFDATGIHSVYIDLSDNTDAGFYAAGNEYQIAIVGAVVDTKTVNAVLASFSIERTSGALARVMDVQSRLPAALTANGNMKSSLMEIISTALTETLGLLAGGFKKFFNVATPTGTVNSLPDVVPGALGGVALSQTIHAGTALAASTSSVDLALTSSSLNDFYNDTLIIITGGTGVGQGRRIADYLSVNRRALVVPNFITSPDATSTYAIVPWPSTLDEWWDLHLTDLDSFGVAFANANTKVGFLPSATAGAAGGVFIAGANASTSVATALAANITGNLSGSVGSLGAQAKADVNAEVVDALNVDTYAEPGQEAPPATTTLAKKIGYSYKAWRNKSTQTAAQYSLYADDTTTLDQKATTSDDATTFTKGEVGTGP